MKDGLAFTDGTQLSADVIIFATGFEGNMQYLVRETFGDEVARLMGDYWGVDDEGELKGAFRPCGRKYFPPLSFMMFRKTRSEGQVKARGERNSADD